MTIEREPLSPKRTVSSRKIAANSVENPVSPVKRVSPIKRTVLSSSEENHLLSSSPLRRVSPRKKSKDKGFISDKENPPSPPKKLSPRKFGGILSCSANSGDNGVLTKEETKVNDGKKSMC